MLASAVQAVPFWSKNLNDYYKEMNETKKRTEYDSSANTSPSSSSLAAL